MLRTSNTQAVSVDHDLNVSGRGKCGRPSHFRVHKIDQGGVRLFESMVYPEKFLRLFDGKIDCQVCTTIRKFNLLIIFIDVKYDTPDEYLKFSLPHTHTITSPHPLPTMKTNVVHTTQKLLHICRVILSSSKANFAHNHYALRKMFSGWTR